MKNNTLHDLLARGGALGNGTWFVLLTNRNLGQNGDTCMDY